ncbi:MAG: SusC/RagA family TonB-linked outer membrane protein [Cyclobacteriaceae bacterium]|nr:SusC/RagA family TonB-linked outer membrane protein [Cyclobacteriaceae bacterium]
MRKNLLVSLLCFALTIVHVWAQERTLSGRVTASEDGTPLPGVNIVLKGTTSGTVTDSDGRYTVTVPADGGTLLFSFIGLVSQEVIVGNRAIIDLAMVQDARQLGEVVVTSFGIERERKSLGYSIQEVKSDELVKARQTSVLNSLQGKIAGAQISSAGGGLGSSTRVVLRGPTSLLGNNQALFVVDGIPINNGSNNNVQASGNFFDNVVDAGNRANDINPEDIESVSVLKGPAAAALYGSRAASGVILITTKKGRSNQPSKAEVTFNSTYLWSKVLVTPKLQNRFGQGQYGDNQTYLNDQESWGDHFDGSLRPYGAVVNNIQQYKPYVALPTNIDDFYEIGKTFQNSLSLSGGTEKSTYYLSVTDLAQTGVLKGTDYHRNNFTLNGSTKLSNKLSSTASVNYVRVSGNLPQTGQRNHALANILNVPRDYSIVDFKDLNNPFNTPDGFFTPFAVNPYYTLAHDYSKQEMNRVYGNFQLNYQAADWISAMARIGTDVSSDQRNTFADIVQYNDPTGPNYQGAFNYDGEYTEQRLNSSEINADFIVTLNRKITEKLQGSLLVGYNVNQRAGSNVGATATNLTIPGYANLANVNGTYTSFGASTKRRLFGVYTSLDLSYAGYLFLGATFRNDWSSTLPKSNNSFSYPSVNASFVITDAFEISNKILSSAKVRASYAEVGNDANPYLTSSIFNQSNPLGAFSGITFPFNNGTVTVPAFSEGDIIGNPNLQPEITKALEFGAEMKLLDGRLNLDVAYYDSKSESQILNASVAPSSGYLTQVINVGSVSNKGIEVTLGGKVLQWGAFRWDLSVNFAKNKNNVEELNEGNTELTLVNQGLTPGLKIQVGKPYGIFEATTTLKTPDGKIVVGLDGIPLDDPNPAYVGTLQPKWTGGLTSTMSFKGLSLSATLDTRQGGNIVSSTMAQLYFNGQLEETAFNDREEWIVPNSVVQVGTQDGQPVYAPNTTPLTMYGTGSYRQYWANIQGGSRNDEVILDASFIKLRELALNYSLPKQWLEKTPFGDIMVGVVGRNLWLHTAKNNHVIDPEANAYGAGNAAGFVNVQGYEFYGIPTQATYGFNLRATF